jgi:hypothetical protein
MPMRIYLTFSFLNVAEIAGRDNISIKKRICDFHIINPFRWLPDKLAESDKKAPDGGQNNNVVSGNLSGKG